MDLNDIRALGARPVRDGAPCGDPVRDEPEFELLQGELRKLELPSGEQPDWPEVVTLAARLLGEKSKDLLVACFLAYAAFRTEGYAGLSAGLLMLTDLSDRYWEGLYPEVKRMRGRLAALEWFASRAAREIGARDPWNEDAEPIEECRRLVGALGDALEAKADGAWALFGEMRAALEEASRRIEAPPRNPSPPPASPEGGSGAQPAAAPPSPAAAIPAAPASIRSAEDANQAISAFRSAGLALAEQLRLADPKDPVSYRLRRQMAWLSLRELPPAVDGVTKIPPVQPTDLAQRLDEAAGRGQWPGVLETTEGRLPSAVMWLDLNRHAWTALDALGPEYAAAADAVRFETASLLRRLPGMERLRFANGAPLADGATLEWVRDHLGLDDGGVAGAAVGPSAAAAAGGSVDESADLVRLGGEARTLLKQKRSAEAFRVLEVRLAEAGSLRAKLRWGLEIARLLREARAPETACLRLRSLYIEADAARIEDWDPALAVEMAKTLLLSLGEVLSSGHHLMGDEVAMYRDVQARLCRLDPAAAVATEQRR